MVMDFFARIYPSSAPVVTIRSVRVFICVGRI